MNQFFYLSAESAESHAAKINSDEYLDAVDHENDIANESEPQEN